MRAGKLRHRITIQSRHVARGTMGGESAKWVDVVQGIPASIEPLNGRELFTAQQVHSEVTVRIRMRYRPGIEAKMRAVYQGVVYSIQYAINPELLNSELQLMCSVGVNEG